MPSSAQFAGAGLKGHLLQIVDPAEEDLPFAGRVRFEGVEEREEVVIGRVETVRADYVLRFQRHRDGLAEIARSVGWTFGHHRTDRAPHLALLALHAALSATAAGGDEHAAPTLMLALGSLAFASPWLLAALAALPVIWWLLRVTPPAPRRMPFPAIRLLLGLTPREETPARTPWWLILLRTILAALVVLALAHPLLNPQAQLPGSGPVALVVDDGWSAARDWSARQAAALDLLAEADRENRQVLLVTTAAAASGEAPPPLAPIRAADARAAIEALQPKPWPGDRKTVLARLAATPLPQGSTTVWLSDGVEDGATAALAAYLADRGSVRYIAATAEEAPRLLVADAAPSEPGANGLGVIVRDVAGAAAATGGGTGQRRGRRPARPRERDDRAARQPCRGAAGDAGGIAQSDRPHRGRRRPIGGRRAFARRALAPPAGRHRCRGECVRPAFVERELLSGACPRAVH